LIATQTFKNQKENSKETWWEGAYVEHYLVKKNDQHKEIVDKEDKRANKEEEDV
jgi:hypothetical protein